MLNKTQQNKVVQKSIIDNLNKLGPFCKMTVTRKRDDLNEPVKIEKRTGLLFSVEKISGSILYTFINGGAREICVKPGDKCEYDSRKMIDLNEIEQYVLKNEKGKIVYNLNKMNKIRVYRIRKDELEKILEQKKLRRH